MKIGLQTWGTDGDVYPFLALAIGLKKAGHDVTVAYTSIDGKDYSHLTALEGIRLVKVNGAGKIPEHVNPYAMAGGPGSFKEYSQLLKQFYDPVTEEMYAASEDLCRTNDLVVGHSVCHTLLTASQKHKCPRVSLVLTPLVVRSKYISPIGFQLGTMINSLMWSIGGRLATSRWFDAAKKIRKKEGLPRVKSLQKELFTSEFLTLVAVSGFLSMPTTSVELPEDLKEFIKRDDPPLFMTFGSCTQYDLKESTDYLIAAAKGSGISAIIQADWSKLEKQNHRNIYCIETVDHAAVFPLCMMIVHHGGAGTTHAALKAGKPSVVVAHGFDQAYWGRQTHKQNVGNRCLFRFFDTPEQVAYDIIVMSESDTLEVAASMGERMNQEDGVQNAVNAIEMSALKAGI